jgi:hypothetical protein
MFWLCFVYLYIYIYIIAAGRHQWCNGARARLECCRFWVRALVGSNQNNKIAAEIINIYTYE